MTVILIYIVKVLITLVALPLAIGITAGAIRHIKEQGLL